MARPIAKRAALSDYESEQLQQERQAFEQAARYARQRMNHGLRTVGLIHSLRLDYGREAVAPGIEAAVMQQTALDVASMLQP